MLSRRYLRYPIYKSSQKPHKNGKKIDQKLQKQADKFQNALSTLYSRRFVFLYNLQVVSTFEKALCSMSIYVLYYVICECFIIFIFTICVFTT